MRLLFLVAALVTVLSIGVDAQRRTRQSNPAQQPQTPASPPEPTGNARVLTREDSLNVSKAFESEIHLIYKFTGDSVILRWSPLTPGAWREANKTGYVIARTELQADGTFDPSTFRDLTPEPMKPWPLERWATIAGQNSTDDMAKIAAQALYGTSFKPAVGFVNQADEFVTRFSFAMLAADMSGNAATALAVRYVDRTIEKGKIYVYRVSSPVDPNVYLIVPGIVVVNTNDVTPTPQVFVGAVQERQNVIELKWNRELHNQYFSGYFIDRSDDNGKTFRRLNRVAFVHPVSEKDPASNDFIVYSDSVTANYKLYQYRVSGITPFGEISPPSAVVRAMGRDRTPPVPPQNVKVKHIGGTRVQITWEYPNPEKGFRGFLVGRGNNPAKQFTPLTTTPLPARSREYVDTGADPMASNYYIVAAVDTANNASLSLSQYAMIIDSVPPSPPKKLAGIIDSLGRVSVHWKLNPEKDIQGYHVYFSNSRDHEFSLVTKEILRDTLFRDSITLKTLTKKVFYKVIAIDYNSNYSGFSDVLELKRPDIVPPSGAVMSDYRISEKGIELEWIPSTSDDLAKTVLYRMDEDLKVWREVASINEKLKTRRNTHTDTTNLKPGKMYAYSLVCFDEDGLQSKRSVPIRLKYADFKSRQAVNNITALANTTEEAIFVNWKYPVKGEYRFVLYRAVNGSAFDSYESIAGTVNTFKDSDVRKGNKYEYSVGVIYKDGKKAPFGKIASTTMN